MSTPPMTLTYRLLQRIPWFRAGVFAMSRPTTARVGSRRSSQGRVGRDARIVRVVLVFMLLAAGIGTLLSQVQARQALEERFGLRATLGAGFVAAYTADLLARERA